MTDPQFQVFADVAVAIALDAGAILRNRMRDLVRNNPHAAKAVSAWVSNIVGDVSMSIRVLRPE